MDTTTFIDSAVVEFSENQVFARIDGTVDTLLEDSLGISGYPTVILVDPDGNEIDRLLGYYPADSFLLEINNYMAGINTLADYRQRLREDSGNPQLHYAMAEKFIARSNWNRARMHYHSVLNLDTKNTTGLADDAAYYMAYISRKEKNYEKAIREFRIMIDSYPESELREDAEVYIPWLHSKAGDTAQAIAQYQAFVENFPESDEIEWVNEQIAKLKNPEEKK